MTRRQMLGAALLGLAVFVLVLAAAGAWLVYSTAGLQWLAARGGSFVGDGLQIRAVDGTLAGGARAQEIVFATDTLHIRVTDARFTISPWSVLMLSPRIVDLGAARVEVRPEVLVCLGATAAQALLGRQFRVSKERGRLVPSPLAPHALGTVHPSSILRAPDDATRRADMQRFVADLRKVAALLRRPRAA